MKNISGKGILESVPEFLQVIIAIAIGVVLITLTFEFFRSIQEKQQIQISGSGYDMARLVSDQILTCWKNHRYGLDSQSDVCKIISVNSNASFSEKDVIGFIDCKSLPDYICPPNDCRSCISDKYSDEDKIKWDVKSFPANISIEYSGDKRAILVNSLS